MIKLTATGLPFGEIERGEGLPSEYKKYAENNFRKSVENSLKEELMGVIDEGLRTGLSGTQIREMFKTSAKNHIDNYPGLTHDETLEIYDSIIHEIITKLQKP